MRLSRVLTLRADLRWLISTSTCRQSEDATAAKSLGGQSFYKLRSKIAAHSDGKNWRVRWDADGSRLDLVEQLLGGQLALAIFCYAFDRLSLSWSSVGADMFSLPNHGWMPLASCSGPAMEPWSCGSIRHKVALFDFYTPV